LKYCWSRLYCVLEFSMQFLLGKTKTKYLRLTLKVYGILGAFDKKKQTKKTTTVVLKTLRSFSQANATDIFFITRTNID